MLKTQKMSNFVGPCVSHEPCPGTWTVFVVLYRNILLFLPVTAKGQPSRCPGTARVSSATRISPRHPRQILAPQRRSVLEMRVAMVGVGCPSFCTRVFRCVWWWRAMSLRGCPTFRALLEAKVTKSHIGCTMSPSSIPVRSCI